MAGLPAGLIKKHHGNMKAAWREYRGGHRRRGRRNPESHSARSRAAKLGWRRRRHGGRRRNPTGRPFSGPRFRPVYRRSGRGWTHGPRTAARGLPRRIRSRRGVVSIHHRRRARRNAAMGHSHRRLFGGGGGSLRSIRSMIPLTHRSDLHLMWAHKGQSLIGGAAGFLVGGVMAQAGGTLAVVLTAFGGGFIIRYALKSRSKYAAIAPAFVMGGLLAAVSHVFSSGSLTGAASLGDTVKNLKMMGTRVKLQGLGAIADISLEGTAGVGQLDQLQAQIQKQLSSIKLPALKGLGDFRTGKPYRPTTSLVGAQDSGWTYLPG